MIKSRRLRWVGHVVRIEEDKSAFKVLTGKPEGKTFRKTYAWMGDVSSFLKKVGVNTRNWIDSPQDMDYWTRLVNAALNLRVS